MLPSAGAVNHTRSRGKLLSWLREFHGCKAAALGCLSRINALQQDDDGQCVLTKEAYQIVVEAMSAHGQEGAVQLAGACALYELSFGQNAETITLAVQADAIESLSSALVAFPNDKRVGLACSVGLSCIIRAYLDAYVDSRAAIAERIYRAGAFDAAINAFETFIRDDVDYADRALALVADLIVDAHEDQDRRRQAAKLLTPALTALHSAANRCAALAVSLTRYLQNMCLEVATAASNEWRAYLVQGGVFEALMRVMKSHPKDAEVQQFCTDAFDWITIGNETLKERARLAGAQPSWLLGAACCDTSSGGLVSLPADATNLRPHPEGGCQFVPLKPLPSKVQMEPQGLVGVFDGQEFWRSEDFFKSKDGQEMREFYAALQEQHESRKGSDHA